MANRHDVIIWDADVYGVEKDYEKIVQQARALALQEAKLSDTLLAFARDVESRSQDENLEPAVFRYLQHFEARIIAANKAACKIALPEYEPRWRSLIDILIEEITRHELVLCDEELELVFLPDDSILSPRTKKNESQPLIELEDQIDFPVTLKQFHQLFRTKVDELLGEHGFILVEEVHDDEEFYIRYVKAITMGKLSLTVSYQGGRGSFEPDLCLSIIEDNMISIAQKSDFSFPMIGGGGIILPVLVVKKRNLDSCINNWKKFEELLSLFRESVLRWSDAVKDIKDIDALINGEMDEDVKNKVHSSLYAPYALITARLAGNPNFEELAISLGSYGADSGRNWGKFGYSEVAVAWPKLVKYLREEVKPLV